jgi:OLD-like protein
VGRDPRAVVLVEGISDRAAVAALADRKGRDLETEGISVVSVGGAQALGRHLRELVPQGVTLAGLYDAGEESNVRRALERAGLGNDLSRPDIEALGFFVCVDDLEDELIRALGTAAVLAVVEAQGELGPFRTLQKQPAQRNWPLERQLHRFIGTKAGRKIRYARLLVEALEPEQVPRPLKGVLAYVRH